MNKKHNEIPQTCAIWETPSWTCFDWWDNLSFLLNIDLNTTSYYPWIGRGINTIISSDQLIIIIAWKKKSANDNEIQY